MKVGAIMFITNEKISIYAQELKAAHNETFFGIGMMYSSNAVFYGRCNDATKNRSVAFWNCPD
jgi:hypothetical protein